MKIAVINTKFLQEKIEDAISSFKKDCQIDTFLYDDISQVLDIMPLIEHEYDAFFINGRITLSIIKKSMPYIKKPMVAFSGDTIEYYQCVLQLNLLENKPFDRIFLDYIPLELQGDFKRLIKDFGLVELEQIYLEKIDDMSPQELVVARKSTLENISKAWATGMFDVVVTRFSTIMTELDALNIPARYVYPQQSAIKESFADLINKSALYILKSNMPAVIMATLKLDKGTTSNMHELALVSLKKALLEFRQINSLNFELESIDNGYKINTTEKIIDKITNNFTECYIKEYCDKELKFNVNLGYGYSDNLSQATINAFAANKASCASGSGYSYIKNANQELIGPLNVKNKIIVPTQPNEIVTKVAIESGLSPLTIQKIMSVIKLTGEDIIKAKDLSEKLGITLRSANRFLAKLEESGYAKIFSLDQSETRGRPSKVYKILLDI